MQLWDLRAPSTKAAYTCYSDKGNVILTWSPDDMFILSSAVDNEVRQYTAADGRLHVRLDLPSTGLDDNYTRAYYM